MRKPLGLDNTRASYPGLEDASTTPPPPSPHCPPSPPSLPPPPPTRSSSTAPAGPRTPPRRAPGVQRATRRPRGAHSPRRPARGGGGRGGGGAGAEELADGEGVGVDGFNAPAEVARVTLHVDRVLVKVRVFVVRGHVCLQRRVMSALGIEHQTVGHPSAYPGCETSRRRRNSRIYAKTTRTFCP